MAGAPTHFAQASREPDTGIYDDGHLRVEHDNYYVSCGGEPGG